MEEKRLFGALTVYRERGAYLRRLEQFGKAKDAYDEAYRSVADGNDGRTLTGRSQVCDDRMQPRLAHEDAEQALHLEPNDMLARLLKARAKYNMTDFERALVHHYRGARRRKKPAYFHEGVSQGLQTIEDCLGKNAGNVMMDFLPLIKQMEEAKLDEHEDFSPVHVSRIPKPRAKQQLTQLEARRDKTLARVMAMKYLGPMAYDKFFLQELLKDPCLDSANSAGAVKLKAVINEALRTINERQDMLRASKPYYTIKQIEKTDSKYQRNYNKSALIKEREVGARTADRLLKGIEKSLRDNRVKDVITQAERMQMFLDTKTPRTLPEKDHYLEKLYREVGEAYLVQHRLSYTLSERGNRRRVAFLMGLPIGRAQSFDSVMAQYPYKFIDTKLATEKVFANLEMCENDMMKCWLTYELANLLLKQRNFALSKFYAKRCQKKAEEIGSVTWWLNACFVLMSEDMQQGNVNEVRIHVEEAYEWSKKAMETERLQSFLAICAAMASETVAVDERKVIKQRERDIVGILPPEQKADTEVLFKRMSTVPVGRHFSVLPGKLVSDQRSERRRRRQRGLTVVNGPVRPLPPPPRSTIPGLQVFET